MGLFFVYILKSSVCLVAFYLFYRLLLSRETFYKFNRIAVLGMLLLSFVLPFCEITVKQHTEVQQTVLTVEQLLLLADNFSAEPLAAQQSTTALWIRVVLLIYLAGVVFFILRSIYGFVRLLILSRSSARWKLQKGVWVVSHDKPECAPFSWMNCIVIAAKDLNENGKEILIHETAHLRKRHSIDLLIADIYIIFQWFNPAAWLFKQEMQNIHEFQADEAVLSEGVNAKQYQLLLIKKAAGTRLYSMANSFNHSKLKKRITMMLKKKSNPWACLKYLYVLPVAAIAVTAFARPEISNELKEISAVKVNDLAGIVEKESKEIYDVETDTLKVVSSGQTSDDSRIIIKGSKVYVTQNDSTISVIGFNKGKDGIHGTVGQKITLLDTLNTSAGETSTDDSPLIIVDGEEVSPNIFNAISTESIEAFSVLKDKTSAKLYGKKGKNGVILVSLKRSAKQTPLVTRADNMALTGEMISIYMNKKESTREELSQLDPDKIAAMEVEKSNGERTIRVTTKEYQSSLPKVKVVGSVKDESGNPVIGASVLISGTNIGTITDMDGNFVLEAPEDSSLHISYIGMNTHRVKAEPKVEVVLKAD